MREDDRTLLEYLLRKGVSRRTFLKFCGAMTATLALPATYAPRVAAALSAAPRLPVVWLEGQDCAGNTEGFLRASHPTVAELVLDTLDEVLPADDTALTREELTMITRGIRSAAR